MPKNPGSVTSTNAIIMLSVPGLFNSPQQMQCFSAQNIYESPSREIIESDMGLDGCQVGGLIFMPIPQSISLQANSPSSDFFDDLVNAMFALGDIYRIQGITTLNSIGKKYTSNNGLLKNYQVMPNAERKLAPRRYEISWESVVPTNV